MIYYKNLGLRMVEVSVDKQRGFVVRRTTCHEKINFLKSASICRDKVAEYDKNGILEFLGGRPANDFCMCNRNSLTFKLCGREFFERYNTVIHSI